MEWWYPERVDTRGHVVHFQQNFSISDLQSYLLSLSVDSDAADDGHMIRRVALLQTSAFPLSLFSAVGSHRSQSAYNCRHITCLHGPERRGIRADQHKLMFAALHFQPKTPSRRQ